jgi:6-pyruvoyl-tetrahydropterin synthase related domain
VSLATSSNDQGAASRTPRRIPRPGADALVAGLLLLFAVAFNLYHLYPEVAISAPVLNDGVLHRLALERARTALAAGQNPTDPWLAPIVLGYPLFHHYQHLAYLVPALLSFPFGRALESTDLLNWTQVLLLSLFPLSIYWSMRRLGFGRLPAAFAGLVASLLSTDGLYGFDLGSYVWRGYGLYTQLWGMLLLPPALAQSYVTLRTGRGYVWAVLLLASTALSHLVYGFIALVSLALFAFVPALGRRAESTALESPWSRARRLILVLALVALVTAYFLIPYVLDRAYMNRSVWEEPGKYAAYGYEWTLSALVRGDLFDFGRFPSLTLLAVAGLVVCLWRWREEHYRVPVVLAVVWMLLYFGRPTWGVLLDLLPFSGDLHFHRLLGGIHLGSILLMGIGLALPWQWALSRGKAWPVLITAIMTAALLVPVYRERGAYLAQNTHWMAENRDALAAEEEDLTALMQVLRDAPPGRVYAGLGGNWGKDYKIGEVPVYALLQNAGFDMLGYLYHALSLNSDVQVLFQDGRLEQYNLFNVRYVLTPTDWTVPSFYQALGDFGRHRLYEIPTSGYFDLVGSDLAFAGNKGEFYPAASAWLYSDLVAAKQHPTLYLDGLPAGQTAVPLAMAPQALTQLPSVTGPDRGRILAEAVESNAYTADVDVERDSFLMLKATYHPNWHAIVDGIEVPTVMLMPSYVGVKVGPGTHHVRLESRPGPMRGILMALGLLTLVLVAVGERGLAKRGLRVRSARADAEMSELPEDSKPQINAWSSIRPHLPYIGGVLLMALLAGLPLFQLRMMSGHDAPEYLTRTVEFWQGLQAGELFPRWAPDLNFGYGEPFFSFNPPLIYYLMAMFRAMGTSLVAAQNLASFLLLAAAELGMYLLGTELFGKRGGLVAAAAYLFASYLLATLYVRQALADFSAFASIPFAFWGLYHFARSGHYRFLLIGAGAVALLMLSSNPVALMAVPALLAWAGWLGWRERNLRTGLRGLVPIALGLGLSSFFWLPALAERGLVQTQNLFEGYLSYRNHFVYLYQFVVSPSGYGLSVAGPGDGMSFALGPVHWMAVLAALVLLWRVRDPVGRGRSWLNFFLVVLVVALFFASTLSRPLWDLVPLLQYLEFPWRFLTLVAFSSAVLCGAVFASLSASAAELDPRLPGVLLAVSLAALLLWGLPRAQPQQFLAFNEAGYSPRAIAAQGIGVSTAGEYTPVWVQQRPQAPATEPLTAVIGQGRVLTSKLAGTVQEYVVESPGASWLRLNTFYFPGWTLYVDGVERPVDHDNPEGVMEFSLPAGQHDIKLVFRDMPVRTWATRLSLLSLAVLLVGGVAGALRSRASAGQPEL